jgi:DNA-directed RNA polymerase specialized sigma24 family protein
MNEKQIKTIRKVCKALANKFTFGHFDVEDIEQEAFIIGMKVLPLHNPKKSSLETFLFMHISNKLKTFKRDHYFRKDFVCKYCGRKDPDCEHCKRKEWKYVMKKHLMEPIDIDNVNWSTNKNMLIEQDVLQNLIDQELMNIVNNHLNVSLRKDFVKMMYGIHIPKQKRIIIEQAIKEILEKHDRE